LLIVKSEPSVGLVGTTIVAADGNTLSGESGDNEGYDAATNTWTAYKPDPTRRNGACGGGIGSKMYVGGGYNGGESDFKLTESFEVSTDAWTRVASMPKATLVPGSAVYKGKLYCFGGLNPRGDVFNYVQIYQP
jgi:N-acetylneuraminic acid mutarotase